MEITFTVKYGKEVLDVTLKHDNTVAELKQYLKERLNVSEVHQKLILKGVLNDQQTLEQSGVSNKSKVLLIAHSKEEVEDITSKVVENNPKIHVPKVSAVKESEKNRKRAAALEPSRIGKIEVLDLPEKDYAMKLLEKLANDLGIREILKRHGWNIGVLKELSPLEQKIAGYNRGRGAEIAIKVRNLWDNTWRSWPDIMDTMIHELAHCDHDEHLAPFHNLNRQLHKELKEFDWTKQRGKKLGGDIEAYNPNPTHIEDSLADPMDTDWRVATSKSSGQKLGGSSSSLGLNLTPSQMAGLMAELRLSQREQEMVNACGSSTAHSTPSKHQAEPQIKDTTEPQINNTEQKPDIQESQAPLDTNKPHDDEVIIVDPPQDVLQCPVCMEVFPQGTSERFIYNHINVCLQPKPQSEIDSSNNVDDVVMEYKTSPQENSHPSKDTSQILCPICGTEFPFEASERYMTNHIERCLA